MEEEYLDAQTEKRAFQEFGENLLKPFIEAGIKSRWTKGQSGNPKGRPPKAKEAEPEELDIPEDASLDEVLAIVLGKQGAVDLAKKLIQNAKNGDKQSLFYIYDRLQGKPTQKVIQEKTEENPLVLILQKLANEPRQLPSPTIIQLEPRDAEAFREGDS